jgi:HTH-type transcriptional regulator/antitoxin HipB
MAYEHSMVQLARTRQQLGSIVRRHRRQRGWTQDELATRAGTRQATISQIEAGQDVRYSTLSDVLAALELELAVQPRSSGESDLGNIF